MKTLDFKINIRAPRRKVWNTLWEDETYRKWTNAFTEGSYAESDWQEGSSIRFLSPDGNGMFSRIEKKIPHENMTFHHLGIIKNGEEQPADKESEQWSNARERYVLSEKNDATELTVSLDSTEEFEQYFKDVFPKALDIVKQLSESN